MGEKFATPAGSIGGGLVFPVYAQAAGGAGTSRTANTFAALTTPCSVTLAINTVVKITISGNLQELTALGGACYLGWAASGANTVAAVVTDCLWSDYLGVNDQMQASYVTVATALTAGSTTFALQYKGDGTNGCSIVNAQIIVERLN